MSYIGGMNELGKRKNNKTKEPEIVAENRGRSLVKELRKIEKKIFRKFSVTVTIIFSMGLWVIKSIWYSFMSGKFFIYKIDRCYISSENQNVILQIIQLVAIFIIWFFINYLYYKTLISVDESKFAWKRKIKVLVFWAVEIIIAFILMLISLKINIFDLIAEVTIKEWVLILILLIILCFMINIFAIEFLFEEKWKKKKEVNPKNKKSDSDMNKVRGIKKISISLVITIALELILVFIFAYFIEYNRSNYKVIMVQTKMDEENEFIIEYGVDHDTYQIFPIAYETEDFYIVTRLFSDNGRIYIDYDFQRIIEKEGQETRYIQNIYNIRLDN